MGGIGTAICKQFCREGYIVIAGCGPNSLRKDNWLREMKAQGFDVIAFEGNVADWDSTKAAFDCQGRGRHGRHSRQQRRHGARRRVSQDDQEQ
jgi:NAD(P)-dependent dehydrogenase (short-subunit alcohol dehydrogenase family)